jgi:L-lactate dehydrogenase complex protein LldG
VSARAVGAHRGGASEASGRDEVLARVREALKRRAPVEAPGPFGSWRPFDEHHRTSDGEPLERFAAMLETAGGEVVTVRDRAAAHDWLERFAEAFSAVAVGVTVPVTLRPALPTAAPDVAPLGVSVARGAIAETGSLLLDARDGRRPQLLPPTHVVLVRAADVHATFRDALLAVKDDLPSAIGLHSGPSKSADIGHIMVKGVHGPGRLIAVVIGDDGENGA